MQILCPDPSSFSRVGLEFARRHANLSVLEMGQAEFELEAPGYDAVLVRFNTRVGEQAMRGRRLKAVLSPTTGLDHIDLRAARRNEVRVYHLQGQRRFLSEISATAELTIALMLAVLRRIPQAFDAVKRGNWKPGLLQGHEVYGKTLGIVGCGRLGKKVAKVGRALGMHVVVFDPFIKRLPAGVVHSPSLQNLLSCSDVVSLHVPLSVETTHMISRQELDYIKTGAVLINTSRGAIVNSDSLLFALETKKLAAAAVDVVENEWLIEQRVPHPLVDYARTHSNLLITPHIGGATFESIEKTDLFILKKYFRDQKIHF